MNRRKAIVGYVIWWVAARLARRAVREAAPGPRANDGTNGGGSSMLSKSKGAPLAVVATAAGLVETVRPIVNRALNDPELHAALRQALDTGRQVSGEVKGTPPKKAAARIARDRKLLKKVENSATDLQKAVAAVVKEPEKQKGWFRRVATPVLVIGGVATAVFVLLRKRGGSQETPY